MSTEERVLDVMDEYYEIVEGAQGTPEPQTVAVRTFAERVVATEDKELERVIACIGVFLGPSTVTALRAGKHRT